MDAFLGEDNSQTTEVKVETTPNIEFQLSKYGANEYLAGKLIPEQALFIHPDTKQQLQNIYQHNLDIPILIHGPPSCGKLTAIVGMLPIIPTYLEGQDPASRINNFEYFKILDAEYNKILYYENVFYLNMAILNNHTEIIDYLNKLNSIAKSRGIDDEKKIIIINHLEQCTDEEQKYVAYMIDKLNSYIAYIFLTTSPNKINKKVVTSCAKIFFKHLDESCFTSIFKYAFSKSHDKKSLTSNHLKHYYKIYIGNNYNLGNTLAQIKYYLAQHGPDFIKDKTLNTKSLISQIATNFIKKRLVLSPVGNSAMDIRQSLYTMVSLNMDMIAFVKEVVKQIMTKKIDLDKKIKILEKANNISRDMKNINKEIVLMESFFYDIVGLIYN